MGREAEGIIALNLLKEFCREFETLEEQVKSTYVRYVAIILSKQSHYRNAYESTSRSLSYDRFINSKEASSSYSAIYCFFFQLPFSSLVGSFKVADS